MGVYYPLIMHVTNIESETEMIICDDDYGMEWAFYGNGEYKIGDTFIAIMDSNGTDEIYDDSIVEGYPSPIKYDIMEKTKLYEGDAVYDKGNCQ
jgi:hypothetical protein